MADTAFQTQYRQEFIKGFEQQQSLLRDSCTTEVQVQGNQVVFLVADSGGAEAVTRGTNGNIPSRPDNLTQTTATLYEWHDKVQKTGFNIFSSQGDQRRIMQMTSMGVINRRVDKDIITELDTATVNAGATGVTASMNLVMRAKTILGNNKVPNDGGLYATVTPAFMAYLMQLPEFSSADYVKRKPLDGGAPFWDDTQGWYEWLNIKWIEHPALTGVGTSSAKCYMYHKSAIGHAAPSELIKTAVGVNDEHEYSYCRTTAYLAAKKLQNSGIVQMVHDDSAYVAG